MPIRKTDSILQSVSAICYVPFDSETIGNPALDVGDVLTFSGGAGGQHGPYLCHRLYI
jgi:hypothetical protein